MLCVKDTRWVVAYSGEGKGEHSTHKVVNIKKAISKGADNVVLRLATIFVY